MGYSVSAILGLAAQCAPNVAPQTVAAIVQAESRAYPFALNVNGARQPAVQTNATDAAATARRYVAAGYSVDLGLGQINSRNMRWLGLTWDNVFDPCTNIAALGKVLTANYRTAISGRDPQTALRVALSLYNTGSASRGFRNGYVTKVVAHAGITDMATAPALTSASTRIDARARPLAENPDPAVAPALSPPPAWNIFERTAHAQKMANRLEATGDKSVWRD